MMSNQDDHDNDGEMEEREQHLKNGGWGGGDSLGLDKRNFGGRGKSRIIRVYRLT